MKFSVAALFVLALWAGTGSVLGQVYSGGDSAGYALVPFSHLVDQPPVPTGVAWKSNDLRACTSGPNFMLIAGFRYEGLWAIGPSSFDNAVYQVPILSMTELANQDPAFNEDDEILGLAASPDRDAVYVSFQPYYNFNGCLPILRVGFDGDWETVVSCEELGAIGSGQVRVGTLAAGSDGKLFAVVTYAESGTMLLRIDTTAEPGSRAEVHLEAADLLGALGGLEEGFVRLLQLAPDDQGRLFVLVAASRLKENGFPETVTVLVRIDADGSMTELTAREPEGADTGYDTERLFPAMACMEGILYDQQDRLLVCGGDGHVFLIDPDEPNLNFLLIPRFAVENTLASWTLENTIPPPGGGAKGAGGCMADVGWGGRRAYASFMGTWMLFNWDASMLDVDGDLAAGCCMLVNRLSARLQ